MILVTGAAGTTGSEVVRLLAAKGVRVRALVRNPEKGKQFHGPGVEVVVADLDKPLTLDPALKGVDKVFLVSSPDPRVGVLHGNVIESAKRAGVKQIVRLSAVQAAANSPSQLLKWHGEVDERLSRSGLSYVILRPHFFMQNLLGMRATIQSEGKIYVPMKEGKISLIDARDIAATAAAILTSEGHSGRVYELTGPEALSFTKIAEKIGAAIGRPVQYVDVPPDAAREGFAAAGYPAWLADGLTEMFVHFSAGTSADLSGSVEKLTGKKPRAFDVFAKDFAGVFAGKVAAEA
ncbi:MAG TPA: SDR family oxidoreductase [Candidatus Eisenbacteria bacterium]|nr:SDR family oxidoreductase [Candidatus Eisenbacteria bacterium]